ncbi:MAG TPA: GNAT family N-acetyltransferase [Daejeonella sp.]|nr:GNAT family N-acetyltransferase [Daejeonella sp.]
MEIRTLENIALSQLLEAFNQAFSDYMIRLQLTPESLATKIIAENINLEASVGVFDQGELKGFILHGLGQVNGLETVYNAGTAIVPEYRGQKLGEQMYRFIIPLLKEQGYSRHQLEVIEGNGPAIRLYEKIGFKISREFGCYKGKVASANHPDWDIRSINQLDWALVKTFLDVEPSWQNSAAAIRRTADQHFFVGAFAQDELVGYAVLAQVNGRIKQFGVKKDKRRQGIGTALFSYLSGLNTDGELSFINYQESDTTPEEFFQKLNMQRFIGTYEMIMNL